MFQLNFLNIDGTVGDLVRGGVNFVSAGTGSTHMATARFYATGAARESGRSVQISRIAGDRMRPSLIVRPNGDCVQPLHTTSSPRERCTKGSGRACFCSPCRASRRGAIRG